MADEPYGPRLLASIEAQCEARNIPDPDAVVAEIEEHEGKALREMNLGELKRVQQNLDGHFTRFLGGKKRLGGEPAAAW